MEEEKQYWSMDELLSITEKVQETEIEYANKYLKVQWCELTESEEPKMIMPDESLPEEEKTKIFHLFSPHFVGSYIALMHKVDVLLCFYDLIPHP